MLKTFWKIWRGGKVNLNWNDCAGRRRSPTPVCMRCSDIHHRIRAGNRIGIDVTSSNFPRRARNTNSGNALLAADGESDIRVFAVAAWRETPYYTQAERAALALAEDTTRLSSRDPLPDAVWDEAARHFDEAALGALVMSVALANLWNRVNVASRLVTGDWVEQLL